MEKLMKNEIEGVKPFNDFWFISCYYHQLIAGISCFGIEKDGILLSKLLMPEGQFTVTEVEKISEKKAGKILGYRCRPCNIREKSLIENIDCGRPLIVGVDCFYLESRRDNYGKLHAPHFILVYGYDLESRIVNVVDHDYENSYLFKKQKISLDNLLRANLEYQIEGKKGFFTSRILYKKKPKKSRTFCFADKKKIFSWQKNSSENLLELKRLFTEDQKSLREKAFLITKYLEKMRAQFLCITYLEGMEKTEKGIATSRELFQGYSNLLSLFWKMTEQNNFEYAADRLDAILRKIDFLLDREKEFFASLMRYYNGKA